MSNNSNIKSDVRELMHSCSAACDTMRESTPSGANADAHGRVCKAVTNCEKLCDGIENVRNSVQHSS